MKQPHNPGLSQTTQNKIPHFVVCEKSGKYQAAKPLTEAQIIKAAKRACLIVVLNQGRH